MTIPTENVKMITIKGQDEDIVVTLSQDDQIHLRYQEGKERKYQFQKEDGNISLIRERKWFQLRLNIFANFQKPPAIELAVPEALLNRLVLDSIAGKIIVEGNVAERMDVNTTAGKIELTEIVAKRVSASTTAGSIQLRGCEIHNGDFNVIAGQIQGTLYGNKNEYNISTSTVAGSSNLVNQIAKTNEKILNFSTVAGKIEIHFREKDTN